MFCEPHLDTRNIKDSAEVLDTLSGSYANVEFILNQEQESGQGYYSGVRFQMYARDQAGTDYFIVDGGFHQRRSLPCFCVGRAGVIGRCAESDLLIHFFYMVSKTD